ncbi:Filaggrin-2 like [Fagus crenata]|jgi:hypothetical protein
MELNQSEEIVRVKRLTTKPEMVVEMNSDDQEEVRAMTQPRFTPKNGSVIPARRRLVKTIMLDSIVHSIASLVRSLGSSEDPKALSKKSSSCSKTVPLPPPNSSNGKKNE